MDKENIIIQLEINMKENLKMVKKQDMEYIIFILLIGNIKEIGKMDFLLDMVLYIFQKDLNMKEIGI